MFRQRITASPTFIRSRVCGLSIPPYALNTSGLLPHMIFLVDFIARGLDQGWTPERNIGCCSA
jgi:hypothetical protein